MSSEIEVTNTYIGREEVTGTGRGRRLNSLPKTCFIQPKSTGLASLFLQFGLLIISGITAMFFFYHVGGYEYMQWNENSTILEPVHHNFQQGWRNGDDSIVSDSVVEFASHADNTDDTTTTILTTLPPTTSTEFAETTVETTTRTPETSFPILEEANDTLVSTLDRTMEFINQTIENSQKARTKRDEISTTTPDPSTDSFTQFIDSIFANDDKEKDNATFGIEQVPMTSVLIGGVEFDWLEVIRISTLVYLMCCVIWFFSMVLFIFTIRCEIIDSVIGNCVLLAVIVIYQFLHSFLIAALVYFQSEMSWRTMAITIGSLVILSGCAFLGCICFTLNCGWVKYIDYMHNNPQCACITGLVNLIKGKHENRERQNNYTMDDRNTAVQNNIQRQENEIEISHFSAF